MFWGLLLICIPAVIRGQLILGPCPIPPRHVKDLDLQKYSGNWYVVAQNLYHPLKAADCEKVEYLKKDNQLVANYSYLDNYMQHQKHRSGKLIKEFGKSSGELQLRLNDFPRNFQFRVLHTNYSDVAVEYTCLSGVFNYTAHVTVLQRLAPMNQWDLTTTLQKLNLTSHVMPHFRKNMKVINHTKC